MPQHWTVPGHQLTHCRQQRHPFANFQLLLTHWGREKMDAISQTTLSNVFSWMKMIEFRLTFHWSFFPKSVINNIPALVQIMACGRPGDKPLSEPMMVNLLTHICVTRPQWVKHFVYGSLVKHAYSKSLLRSRENSRHPDLIVRVSIWHIDWSSSSSRLVIPEQPHIHQHG